MRPAQRALAVPLLLLVGGVLVTLVLLPNLKLLASSVLGPDGPTLAGFGAFFSSSRDLQALANTLLIAVGSVLLAAALGVPLAVALHTWDFPGRRWFAAVAMAPVLLPPLVGVVAFYFLYAESGIVTKLVQHTLHLSRPPWRFHGVGAVLVVHAYSFYVYFYAFCAAGLARLDSSQLEAAATLGAGRARRVATVLLPLLTPSLVGAGLLVFMMSMASYTAPLLLEVRVLTIQLLDSRRDEQWLAMGVETVVLVVTCVAFMALLRWVEGRGRYIGGSKGSATARQPIARGWRRVLLIAGGVVVGAALLLPHLMLLLMSFADDARWTTQLLPPVYTTDAFAYLLRDPQGRQPFVNSVILALESTLGLLLWAVPAAYLFARYRFRGRGLLEGVALLPYAIPGTVLGVGLAEWFSVHQPWCGRTVLIGTTAILPLAYFVRNLPLAVRSVQASLAQLDPTLEEAAATLGSAPATVVRRVVLPLVLPGAVAGALLAMINALGEFVASMVLYIPDNRPLSIEIWTQVRNSYFNRAAADGVVLVLLVGGLLAAAQAINRRDLARTML